MSDLHGFVVEIQNSDWWEVWEPFTDEASAKREFERAKKKYSGETFRIRKYVPEGEA